MARGVQGGVWAAALCLSGCLAEFPDTGVRAVDLDEQSDAFATAAPGSDAGPLGPADSPDPVRDVGAPDDPRDAASPVADVGPEPDPAPERDAAPDLDEGPSLDLGSDEDEADHGLERPDMGPPPLRCQRLTCYAEDGSQGHMECAPAPRVACGLTDWEVCTCSTRRHPVLVFDPPPGFGRPLRSVTVVHQSDEPLALSVDGECVGAADQVCDGLGTCNSFVTHTWADLPESNDASRTVRVFPADLDGDCPDDGPSLFSLRATW